MNGRNVGVIERRQYLGFALEPAHTLRIERECFGQNLDRNFALQLGVACTPHLTHTAPAEQRRDFIRTKLCADGDGQARFLFKWFEQGGLYTSGNARSTEWRELSDG